MSVKLIPVCDIGDNGDKNYNTCNIHKLSPFFFIGDNRIVLDNEFYKEISNSPVLKYLNKEYVVTTGDNIMFGDRVLDFNYWKVYTEYVNWFNAENWATLLTNSSVINLTNNEKDQLYSIGLLFSYTWADTPEKFEFNVRAKALSLVSRINTHIDSVRACHHTGVFAKSGRRSAKKQAKPTECLTGESVISNLLQSKDLVAEFGEIGNSAIILRKWEKDISAGTEFRVFIKNNKIAGISQQYLYETNWQMENIWGKNPKVVLSAVTELWGMIKGFFLPNYNYSNCVLDIWLSVKNDKVEANLIEINPCGYWCSSGSALYNWETDPPDPDNVQIRITCDKKEPTLNSDFEFVKNFTEESQGIVCPVKPEPLSADEIVFLLKMVLSELTELAQTVCDSHKEALGLVMSCVGADPSDQPILNSNNEIIAAQADAIVDAYYYMLNVCAKKSINISKVFMAVHKANMNKKDKKTNKFIKREDGKIIKPENWKPPDILSVIQNM